MLNKIRYSLFIFFVLFNNLLLAQDQKIDNPNGYNKYFYQSGRISSEGNLKDGKPQGYWINYFESGQKKSEGNRKNFQLDSVWNFYNEKGIKVLCGDFNCIWCIIPVSVTTINSLAGFVIV